jgi:hypothetical protein
MTDPKPRGHTAARSLTIGAVEEFIDTLCRNAPQLREGRRIELRVPRRVFITLRAEFHEFAAFGLMDVRPDEKITLNYKGWDIEIRYRPE